MEKLSREACASSVGGANPWSPEITSAPSACFDSFRSAIALAHHVEALDRVAAVDRQRPAHRGDAVAELAVLVLAARIETGTSAAQLEPLGAHARAAAASGAARR